MSNDELREEALAWLRSRPKSVHHLMIAFPPYCVVTFTDDAPLCDKHADQRKRNYHVVSYDENGTIGICGLHQTLDDRTHVQPSDIVVVRFNDWTPERIREALES